MQNQDQRYPDSISRYVSMKWYKFQIYFSLWASAVIQLINSAIMLTGMAYVTADTSVEMIYSYYKGLQAVDVVMGLISIGFAVMLIITRFALARFKSYGPRLLIVSYGINAAIAVLYPLAASAVTGLSILELFEFNSLCSAVVMIVVNRIYYDKRSHFFVN